ncbi:MAG: helicase-related protein [Ignavibacteriales bacterium]|nr:helicase-related protein [Ignavibacteriales bacterium]
MTQQTFQPGSLVKLRNREWVVMPSSDKDLLVVKPLGGSDEETTGIFLPLAFGDEIPTCAEFPYPASKDIGNYTTANLLYNAARLSFRNVSGPFRCMGKLSFRPRSYQLVPLVMSLKQDFVRLLIADDVGVGKTIEALLIVRELLDRGEIKRFAVVCLPHLCEQWQQELKDKFSLDAVIIRSSTAAQLDRKIQGDGSIFREYPYQVVSIDFIKSGPKREIFLNECPELIIVDEAHTCAKPDGQSVKQQQRHHLVHAIAAKSNQHLIMMTATPHSGKQAEFQSLLGLLKNEFETIDLVTSTLSKRKEVADHLIIRRRADVEQWLEKTEFPQRDSKEVEYNLSEDYKIILNDLLTFARKVNTSDLQSSSKKKFRYFAILSLLRGVMSSPSAGIEMLSKKALNISEEAFENEVIQNPVADTEGTESDALPIEIIDKSELKKTETKFLRELADKLENVKDNKAAEALKVSLQWLKEGFNPVIFCRFIETAKYLGEYFKEKLPKNTDMLVITGEMVDEQRREKIDELEISKNKHHVLISTDCLSEGVNLQKFFNAVLHYDLPWNPNRLEQREGRVDRFGQTEPVVKAYLLWGKDNPIDSVVLKILLRKAREIRKQTGISVPFPEDSQSILDSLLNAVILNPNAVKIDNQMELGFDDQDIETGEVQVTNAYEKASERDKITRSIFAQHSVKASEIEKDLKEVDEAVGNPVAVKQFVVEAVTNLGGQIIPYKSGYRLYTTNLNPIFKSIFNYRDEVLITFESPTPEEFLYIGRNCLFVEQLSHYILNKSLVGNGHKPIAARASVIPSKNIKTKTTIIQIRVRNIISDKSDGKQLVAEEMILWGYENNISERKFITHEKCKTLLAELVPSSDYERPRQEFLFDREIETIKKSQDVLTDIVRERSNKLIEAHERFRKLVGGSKYQLIEPVLPPDVLGIYIIIPQL